MISAAPADFCFKQFSIWHQQCAMKVNTDGILLGAWANIDNAKKVLDIGTGTGLIALMLAQRTELLISKPNISALEIDLDAFQQAKHNIEQSPWSSRLQLIHHDFLTWQREQKVESESFDVLVSNPPYFEDSLLSDDQNKNLARHTKHMSFKQLLSAANTLLTHKGKFNLILPTEQAKQVIKLASNIGLQLIRQTSVKTTPQKAPSRLLFCLAKVASPATLAPNELIIRDNNNKYTSQYIDLCKDFYLKM